MNLLEICKLAVLSYEQETNSVDDLEYVVTDHPDCTVISVRGTEASSFIDVLLKGGWRDIILDIRFIPRYHKTLGWCHGGFLSGALKIIKEIEKLPLPKNKHIIFTGHSMGAAVSLLAAHLMFERTPLVKWVGFGCPKPFIGRRITLFPTYNVVNGADVVTTLPIGWLFDYRTNTDGDINIGDNTIGCLNTVDHRTSEYISSMSRDAISQTEV